MIAAEWYTLRLALSGLRVRALDASQRQNVHHHQGENLPGGWESYARRSLMSRISRIHQQRSRLINQSTRKSSPKYLVPGFTFKQNPTLNPMTRPIFNTSVAAYSKLLKYRKFSATLQVTFLESVLE